MLRGQNGAVYRIVSGFVRELTREFVRPLRWSLYALFKGFRGSNIRNMDDEP